MPTLFPGANDSFSEPAAPSSTPLDDAGGSGRNMVEAHEDMGDAVMAMQAEATLAIHSHDGSTARHGSKLSQVNTHQSPDTDSGPTAIHHTIGTGANQGAAGNHTHSAAVVWPVGSVFITEVSGNPASSPHNLPGTWTQITGRFLVAAGSTYTAGATGGSADHDHDLTVASAGSHTHTSSGTSTDGSHTHTSGNTGSNDFDHDDHPTSSNGSAGDSVAEAPDVPGMTYVTINTSHNHTNGSSTSTSHSHGVGSSSSSGGHSHTVADTDTESSHGHTASVALASNLIPYLVVYVWFRSA